MNESEIKVSASGYIQAPYDLVHFAITVSDTAETGPTAKAKIKDSSEAVLRYVDALIAEGRVHNKVLSLSIDPYTEYMNHSHKHAGYKASLKVTFSTRQVDKALFIQECLTEYPQSKVDSLTFGFENPEALREKALEAAWEAVLHRWAHQRMVIKAHSDYVYSLKRWDADYEEFRPFSKTAAPTADKAGVAQVVVTLTTFWG